MTAKSTSLAPFITFEGGDGAGKTTQIRLLAERLRANGHDIITTREPGGAPGAEKLRELLVTGDTGAWTPMSEALLMYAARAEHLAQTINPARARGAIVLCDRFSDSTRAYQGHAGKLDLEDIETLEHIVVGDKGPTLTIILDLPVEAGLKRAGGRGDSESRFERKGRAFQEAVRAGFLEIARTNPNRCRVIDATRVPEIVAEDIYKEAKDAVGAWVRAS